MLGEPLVNGDESQALHSRLCDEHAVKRVAVMGRERSGGQRVSRRWLQLLKHGEM